MLWMLLYAFLSCQTRRKNARWKEISSKRMAPTQVVGGMKGGGEHSFGLRFELIVWYICLVCVCAQVRRFYHKHLISLLKLIAYFWNRNFHTHTHTSTQTDFCGCVRIHLLVYLCIFIYIIMIYTWTVLNIFIVGDEYRSWVVEQERDSFAESFSSQCCSCDDNNF